MDKKFKICFDNADIQTAYSRLLEHVCNTCQGRPAFRTFQNLKDHVRKEHELYYCELCVDNLKVKDIILQNTASRHFHPLREIKESVKKITGHYHYLLQCHSFTKRTCHWWPIIITSSLTRGHDSHSCTIWDCMKINYDTLQAFTHYNLRIIGNYELAGARWQVIPICQHSMWVV